MYTDLTKKIVNRTLSTDNSWGMTLDKWDWVPGVGMYGISCVLEYTKDEDIRDFVEKWIDGHIRKAYEVKVVNAFAPMLTVIEYAHMYGGDEYVKTCYDVAEWILNEAPRTCDGGLEHTVTEKVEFKEQMWADTLFMACLFMAKMGIYYNEKKYFDFAVDQFVKHYKLLQDPETGLCFHGWNGELRNHMSGAYWGRANAWVIEATAEVLEIGGEFKERDFLVKSFKKLVEAVCRYQRENGMFSTVLDRDFYDEASATAGIACGIYRGVRTGILDGKYLDVARKAEKAVKNVINDRGEVMQVSGGTAVQKTIDAYNDIAIYPTLYGQALTLMMLVESDKLK